MKNKILEQKIVLITGCSSGMGLATAVYLASKEYKVYASMRNLKKKDNLLLEAKKAGVTVRVVQLDVNEEQSIKSAVSTVLKKEGRIDVLVNNAGFGSAGFLEDFSIEEIRDQFETNFFGLVRLIKEVLPIMRKQKQGHIVNISSIGGKIAFPAISIYSASKFAVEALTESLRVELASFGIKTTAIEPSGIKTNFNSSAKAAKKSEDPSSPYYEYFKRFKKNIEKISQNNSVEPIVVAKTIYSAIISENPKRSYPAGKGARILFILKSLLPNSVFEKIMNKQFLG